MSPVKLHKDKLLETIKIVDGNICNGAYHWERMLRTHRQIFSMNPTFIWKDIENLVPVGLTGAWKFRLIYSRKIEDYEFVPYEIFVPKKWKLVEANNLEYPFKYHDRSTINDLRRQNEQLADDIIFVKNGKITDASYANLVFFDGDHWWTPSTPLLAGTQRAKLLAEARIKERMISVSDLKHFSHLKLINALLEFDFPSKKLIDSILPPSF